MRVRVDPTKCQGYGMCNEACPEIFTLDEWGFASVDSDADIPVELHEAVRRAAAACPEKAITVED